MSQAATAEQVSQNQMSSQDEEEDSGPIPLSVLEVCYFPPEKHDVLIKITNCHREMASQQMISKSSRKLDSILLNQ